MKKWFVSPIYTVGSFFLAVAVFFLVPLPWYFALLAAIGTYFATGVLSAAMMVITREDAISAAERAVDEYTNVKQFDEQLGPEPAATKAAQIDGAKVVLKPLIFVVAFIVFALCFWRYDLGLVLSIGAAILVVPIMGVVVALPVGYVLGKHTARRLKAREPFDDAEKLRLVDMIADLLNSQKMIAGDASVENESGQPKRKALGYVYGFVDAALRARGQDMSDASVGVPITFQVIRKLWPDRATDYMAFITENVDSDDLIMVGIMHGGQQYVDYISRRKPDDSRCPMGLARFMIEGDNGRAHLCRHSEDMKRILKLDRLRLRGLSGAKDEVLLTATAQNLRRLAKLLCRAPPPVAAVCLA